MRRRSTIRKAGRAWALLAPDGALVALVLYRKGVEEIARRLRWKPRVA